MCVCYTSLIAFIWCFVRKTNVKWLVLVESAETWQTEQAVKSIIEMDIIAFYLPTNLICE